MLETPLAGAVISLLIGLLLGLERERSREPDEALFAGIRTFPLLALCGYVGALGSQQGVPLALPAVILAVGGLVVASYLRSEIGHKGATTETAALLAPLLAALVAWKQAPLAAGLAVLVTLLLTMKAPLHKVAGAVSADEILAILKFGLVAIILVPHLPDQPMGPYGALVPQKIGVVVVLLSGVSLAGYLLVRLVGGRAGWPLAGGLGGLVSSTAVTLSFSGKARESADLARPLAVGVILASTILYLRGIVVVGLLDRTLAVHLAPRLAVLFGIGLLFAAVHFRQAGQSSAEAAALGNPVELGRAILLALVFAAVIVLSRVAQARLGTVGLWSVGALGGLVDVDSVAVAASRLRQQGSATVPAAAGAYLLATLANLVFKAGVVLFVGKGGLARRVLPAFAALAIATGLVLAFW